MRCTDCGWKYPENLLSPMFNNGEYTQDICAICALKRVNETHGSNMTHFVGQMAEANRIAALRWRDRHPNDAPDKE